MSASTDLKPEHTATRLSKESIYHQDSYAARYDEGNFGGPFGEYLRQQEVNTLLSLLHGPQQRVLDVGAGTGKLSIPLNQKYPCVISMDASSQMLENAILNGDGEGVSLNCIVGDVQRLCFPDQYFDSVLMSRTLMHVPDWREGIAEICRVSRATVVLDFPPVFGVAGIGNLLRRARNLFPKSTKNYRLFFTSSIIKELQKNDFAVVHLQKQYFLPVGFHRWLNRPRFSISLERFCAILRLNRLLGAPVTIKAVRLPHTKAQSWS